jgi:hypothetical protein
MLSASPFILAQEVKPISSPDQPAASAQATGPDVSAGPEEIQKVAVC